MTIPQGFRSEWQPPTEVPGPGGPPEVPQSEPEESPSGPNEVPAQPVEVPPEPVPEVRSGLSCHSFIPKRSACLTRLIQGKRGIV